MADGKGETRRWQDKSIHPSHVFDREGYCRGCMMHRDWAGSRSKCSIRFTMPPRRARPLEGILDE